MAGTQYKMDLDVSQALRSLDKFNKGLGKTDKEMEKVDKQSATLTKSFGGLKTVLAGIASLGFGAMTKAAIQSADALGKVSNKVGLSVKALQELRYVADQAGIAQGTLDTSMQRFSRRVGEAANGTGVLKKDLLAMNIAIKNTDGSMRKIDDIFTDYTNGIRNASSAQEKLRLSVAAFDMEGANMVNMLGDSADAMRDMRMEASKLAPLIGANQVEAATRANDAWSKVKFQFKQIGTVVLTELAPGMEDLANSISKILANEEAVRGMRDAFKGISDALSTIAEVLSNDLLKSLFDIAKWGALALAVRAVGKGFHFFGRILGEYKTIVKAATSAGTALGGSMTLGAVASKKFFTALQWGIKTVAWTALLGFLLDIKGSLVSLTGVFGSAEESATGFFDTLHQKAIAFAESDAGVIETAMSGIRTMVEGASGSFGGDALDFAFGKDFGKQVTIDTRADKPGYVRDNAEEIAAAKAHTKQLDEEAVKRRAAFQLPRLNTELFKNQIGELSKSAEEASKPFMQLQATLDPLSAAVTQFAMDQKVVNDALARGDISKERATELLALLTKEHNAFKRSIQGPELNAHVKQMQEYQKTIQATAKAYTPVQTQAEKFKKTAKELKDALAAKNPKLYAIAINNLNKEMKAFNRAQLGESKKWSDGWKRAMMDYVDDAEDAASKAETLFKKATQGMEDAIVGFAKTGKFEWKSLFADLLETQLRSNIQGLFGKLMGGLSGMFSSTSQSVGQSVGQIATGVSGGNTGGGPIGEIFGGAGSASGGGCVSICPKSVDEIGGALGESTGGFMDMITGALGGIWDGITGALGGAGDWLGDIFGGITDGAGSIWDSVSSIFDGEAGGLWDSIKTGAGGIWDSVTSIFDGSSGGIIDSITGMFDGGLSGIIDSVGDFFGGSNSGKVTVEAMGSLDDYINGGGFGGGLTRSQQADQDRQSALNNGGLFESVGSLFGAPGKAIGGIADSIIGGSTGGLSREQQRDQDRQSSLSGTGGGLWDAGSSIVSSVGSAVTDFGSSLWDAGASIVSGIGDVFSGWFADGGMIPAGSFGIVGERGPEVATGPMNIQPITAGGGGGNVYNTYVNAVDVDSFKKLAARDPGFMAAVVQQGMKSYAGAV